MSAVARRIHSVPRAVFATILVLLIVARSGTGLTFVPWPVNGDELARFVFQWRFASHEQLLLAHALGVNQQWQWTLLHAVLVVLVLLAPIIILWRTERAEFDLLLVLLALVPMVSQVLRFVGHYDGFLLLGSLLVGLAPRRWIVVVGATVMCGANAEQAVVACGIYALATFTTVLRSRRDDAVLGLAVVLLLWIPEQVLSRMDGDITRSELLVAPWPGVVRMIEGWPASVWGWYGALWFLAVAAAVVASRSDRVVIGIAFVLIPAAATVMTIDGFRVFWGVSTLALIALLRATVKRVGSTAQNDQMLVFGLLAVILVPSAVGGLYFVIEALAAAIRIST